MRQTPSRSATLVAFGLACTLVFTAQGIARAATPSAGTVSESSTAQWTGGPGTPTAAATCGGPSNAACDNFQLTIQPASFPFNVEITLTPQGADDYDLEVYGPDGQMLGASANSPATAEQVILRAPAAGTYTVSASPYVALLAYSAEARIVPQPEPPPLPPPSTEVPPTYVNYLPPQGMGTGAGEPTLGVNERTGNVMYIAGLETLKVRFDQCTSPASATWTDQSFVTTSQITFDPLLFTDQPLGRTFASQLLFPTKQSAMAFTDNDGTSWTPSQGSGILSGVDHQTLGGGPFSANGPLQPLTSYPNAVYYCAQDIAYANCAVSLDGGLTFGPAVPMYTLAECGGLHGHIKVGPDGTAYVPNKNCGGEQAVAVSTDNGLTWAVRRVPGSHAGDSDPSAAVANDGTLYLGWADGSQHPYVAVSHDNGETWTNIQNVGTTAQGLPENLQNVTFPAMVAGDGDRAAFAFLGTTTPGNGGGDDPDFPAEWHLYIAHTYDGGQTWVTVNATPGDPVQRGTICGGGTGCGTTRNLLDFMDATIDADGRVLVGYADGCVGACKQGPPNSFTELATIARQNDGKRMYAAKDLVATSGPPTSPLTKAAWVNGKVQLTWSQPEANGAPITAYRVYRKAGNETAYKRLRQLYPDTFSYTDLYVNPALGYLYYVTAVNSRGESVACAGVAPEQVEEEAAGLSCVPPGRPVSTDESEDAPLAALDVQTLSIAEPATTDGSHKIVFTLEVKDLQTITPGNAWMILWNRPRPDALYDRNYVVMRATGLGTADFKYGKLSPPNVNQATDLGNATGSFGTDGTITITLDASKADGVGAGNELSGIEVRTFALHASGLPSSQATALDYSPVASYTLAGNANCDNAAPTAAADTASTTKGTPVALQVLANDRDPDGDALKVVKLSAPKSGKAVSRRDGSLSYTPNAGFVGTDTFNYTIDDGNGHTATGKVTVTVR